MFTHIEGSVVRFNEQSVVIATGGLGYEIVLPPCIYEPIRRRAAATLALEIYASLTIEGNSAKFTYFGFNNLIEREFFESLITVASIGPRTAARAFSKPMSAIAHAIDTDDAAFLTSLPGIGRQKARDIIAKLQGKVARFLLITADTPDPLQLPIAPDFVADASIVLAQLGYKELEAKTLIDETLKADPTVRDVESLLTRIYRRSLV